MLVLTRRIGERIIINHDIDVTVLGVKGNQVRLGIAAPKTVAVHREEIYDRIMEERKFVSVNEINLISLIRKPQGINENN